MAGTRGGVGRIAAMVVGLVVVLVLLLADAARAGTYDVAQCGWGVGVELDPSVPRTEGAAAYLRPGLCTAPPAGTPRGLAFDLGLAFDGEQGRARARWSAPPGTTFAGVRFTWASEIAPAVWEVAGVDSGEGFAILAMETATSPPQVVAKDFAYVPARAFEVRLQCLILGPYGCTRSVPSSMWLNDLTLTIADPVPPQARLGGALVASGWHRGTVPLELAAEDAVGAGVAGEGATVDGAPVLGALVACATATIEGALRATRLRPCPAAATRAAEVDTTGLADGVHTLRGCATDFSGGRGCAPEAQIQVDNSAPLVDFAAAPEGRVAASVSDAFSGPAAGTISVRAADSEAWTDLPTTFDPGGAGTGTLSARLPDLSAGAYFFRATALDAAGNSGSAQLRAAGGPAAVRRQVSGAGSPGSRGRATHLVAYLARAGRSGHPDRRGARPRAGGSGLTVPYGTRVEVRGRLTDARRAAVANRPVAVVVRAVAGGAGAPERRRVVTDRAGHFALRLATGTSRRVLVSFHGGDGLAPARRRALGLRVRAAVSFAATPRRLRTGESVAFSGRVLPGPARIPARGKLVTIQYLERASGRWRPALVVRTGARGHFKARYRFRYITAAARVRLRATVLPEAGWPYAAGSSSPVTVRVDGR